MRAGLIAVCFALAAAAAFADPPPSVPAALLKQRLEAARTVYTLNTARLKAGQAVPSDLFAWSERWLDAELALTDKPAERIKLLRAHVERTREVENMTAALTKAGLVQPADAAAATYYRLEAEIRLAKDGAAPVPATGDKAKPDK